MATQALYGRQARLTFLIPTLTPGDYQTVISLLLTITGEGDPTTPGMRFRFKVMKTTEKEPNTSEIIVTNLSDRTRSLLNIKGVRVLLEAGYIATGITQIFLGDARTIDHLRKGADWDTVIKLGDGDTSYRFARMSASFSPGVTAGAVLSAIALKTGLGLGNSTLAAAGLTTVFQQGYAITGSVQRSLDRLLRSVGYSWSIQDNALQILAPGQTLALPIPLISPTTGLLDSPQMGTPEKQGAPPLCEFKSLLISTKPGAKVHLKSERYDNDMKVVKCQFIGDTAGGPWDTVIYGAMVNAG